MLYSFLLYWLTSTGFAGTIVDATGHRITASSVTRIVTLGGSVTEIVFELGLGDQIIGVDLSSSYPKRVRALANVGYHRQLDASTILYLKPDLVIATEDSGPPQVIQTLRTSGIDVAVLNSPKNLNETEQRIQQIATLLDKEKEGSLMVWSIQDKLRSQIIQPKASRVLFLYARPTGSPLLAGMKTAAASIITMAGGVNALQNVSGYQSLDERLIVASQPEYILLTKDGLESLGGKANALRLPGIQQTPAGKKGNLIVMDDLLLLGFGPRVADAIYDLSSMIQ